MTTWNEVQANPDYQKLDPQEKEAARTQYFNEVVAPKVPKEQLTAVRQQFDKDTLQAAPAEQKKASYGRVEGPLASLERRVVTEPFMKAVTGAAGAAAGGLRMLPALLGDDDAVDKGQALAEKLTYEPKSELGQQTSRVLEYPGRKLGEFADFAGRKTAEATGSPALGAGVNVGIQGAAQVLLGKGAGAVGRAAGIGERGAAAAGAATRPATTTLELAKDFGVTKLGTEWDDIPPGVQKKLKTAARDPAELAKLDPEAVQVEARAERLKYRVTRGQVTRDPAQLGSENRISRVAGNPVSEIKAEQDEALHTALDDVRKSTGATAQTREAVGKSVQDSALREKESASKANYDTLFAKARATQPKASVSPQPLYDLLEQKPHLQDLDFVKSWLKKAGVKQEVSGPGSAISLESDIGKALSERGTGETHIEMRNIPLAELDHLRSEAAGIAAKGGKEGYHAGLIVNAIDKAFEKIPDAASAWREARDAFKAHKLEFEDQQIVRDLTASKTRTDRTTPLAKTTSKVLSRDAEDIGKLKKTLTQGGTPQTRAAGEAAWKNLQAGVIDYLRQKAHGRKANVNENRTDEFNSAYRDAFSELDKDGKIDVIFDKKQAAKLREIYAAVGDVRLPPSARLPGSDTAANLEAQKVENTLSGLEKVAKLPYIGPTIAGGVSLARQLWDAGRAPRAAARAKTTPLTEAAETAKRTRAKADRKRRADRNTLKSLKRAATLAPLTLQGQNPQQ